MIIAESPRSDQVYIIFNTHRVSEKLVREARCLLVPVALLIPEVQVTPAAAHFPHGCSLSHSWNQCLLNTTVLTFIFLCL